MPGEERRVGLASCTFFFIPPPCFEPPKRYLPRMLDGGCSCGSILTLSLSFYHKGRGLLSLSLSWGASLHPPHSHPRVLRFYYRTADYDEHRKAAPHQTVMISIAVVVTKRRRREATEFRRGIKAASEERADQANRASERNNKRRDNNKKKNNRNDDKKAHALASERQMGLRKCASRIAIRFRYAPRGRTWTETSSSSGRNAKGEKPPPSHRGVPAHQQNNEIGGHPRFHRELLPFLSVLGEETILGSIRHRYTGSVQRQQPRSET